MSTSKIRVWDPFVRLFHWSLVISFFTAYLSGEEESLVHIYSGYVVIFLVLSRLIWGFVGGRYARFREFACSPASALEYLKALAAGRPKNYIGHNPAAAWMIFALLFSLIMTSVSGLKVYGIEGHGPLASSTAELTVLTADFSPIRVARADDDEEHHDEHENEEEEVWEEIHEVFANLTLLLVLIHIAGVIVASKVHKENLVKAMITGTKDA
ncbi:MAG: cytochrome b/b6 domain-containing protein [Gammaproteobacteria bacterium]|jgi:cytochrome b